MTFFKPSKQKKLKKFLISHDFDIEEGAKHSKAVHSSGVTIIFPRHKNVSSGVTQQICKKLESIGIDKAEIERSLL